MTEKKSCQIYCNIIVRALVYPQRSTMPFQPTQFEFELSIKSMGWKTENRILTGNTEHCEAGAFEIYEQLTLNARRSPTM